jgi:hypothetical protein
METLGIFIVSTIFSGSSLGQKCRLRQLDLSSYTSGMTTNRLSSEQSLAGFDALGLSPSGQSVAKVCVVKLPD